MFGFREYEVSLMRRFGKKHIRKASVLEIFYCLHFPFKGSYNRGVYSGILRPVKLDSTRTRIQYPYHGLKQFFLTCLKPCWDCFTPSCRLSLKSFGRSSPFYNFKGIFCVSIILELSVDMHAELVPVLHGHFCWPTRCHPVKSSMFGFVDV